MSKTFATDTPGTLTTRAYAEAVHYETDEGGWEPIDVALTPGREGRLENGANSFGLSVAADSGQGLLAELDLGQGRRIGFSLDAEHKRPGVADRASGGSAVVYRQVRPHVDLRLTSTATGLKEELVLRSPAAPDTFEFPLRLEGVRAQLDPATGAVVYHDAAGELVAAVPAGWMEDAAGGTPG
ncbi:MAG TPA: hypothetical protein VM324_12745, partial [Egibacteraceae bacterium]|nr:hypothetical protein [Egibacteraceae bacterium]